MQWNLAGGRNLGVMTNIADDICLYLANPGDMVKILNERLASQIGV